MQSKQKQTWGGAPCSFLFAPYLEWSLNISIDKKSNTICIFANLCSTLISLWFKSSSAWFNFRLKFTKERGKKLPGLNLNVDRQFFKDVICIFYVTLFNLTTEGWGQYQFLGKIATHLPYFHLLTPLSKDQIKIFIYSTYPFLLQPAFLLTQPPFNQLYLLLQK